MRIIIDCRPLQYVGPGDERARLILSVTHDLDVRFGVECIYLVDKSGPPIHPAQQTIRISTLPGRAGWKLWYDWKLPRLAKKLHADWIMTAGGVAANVKNIPQCCWMPGLALQKPRAAGKKAAPYAKGLAGLAQKRQSRTLEKTRLALCFSAAERDSLISAQDPENHPYIFPLPPQQRCLPLSSMNGKRLNRNLRTERSIFLRILQGVKEDELVDLLKALSRFKKRMHSNLPMVLAGYPAAAVRTIADKLESYKYRQDVIWHREYSGILAAGAYAILRPFPRVDLGLAVIEAWKSGVPVITVTDDTASDIAGLAGDAVLYAQPGDAGSLAEKLMLIYKDERLRSSLIEKGFARLKEFSSETAADTIWNALQI